MNKKKKTNGMQMCPLTLLPHGYGAMRKNGTRDGAGWVAADAAAAAASAPAAAASEPPNTLEKYCDSYMRVVDSTEHA